MRVRFQADANLDVRIIRGLKRRQPETDFRSGEEAGLIGLSDPEVLRMAADSNRVLVSHDQRTMPGHFAAFVASHTSPGVIIVSQEISIGVAIEELLLIWVASQAEEWRNRLVWVPL